MVLSRPKLRRNQVVNPTKHLPRCRPAFEILETRTLLNAAGMLDPGFGTGGKVLTDIPGSNLQGLSVLVQTGNKLIVAGTANPGAQGRFTLARYNADGSLDSTFGVNGIATGPLGNATAATLQSDGSIVMVGTDSTQALLVSRFTPAGILDPSFGTGGSTTASFGTTNVSGGVAVQSDGKIVVSGINPGMPPVSFSQNEVARFNPDGTLDTNFGSGGRARGTGGPVANTVLIQPDGSIVIGGRGEATTTFPTDTSFYLSRFTSTGQVDTTFNGGVDLGYGPKGATDFALQSDGKIVAVGSDVGTHVVVRLNTDGTLDSTFGADGKVFTEFGSAVAIQSDGHIVVAGTTTASSGSAFAVERLLPDGSPETRFGAGGTGVATFSSPTVNDVALQANGQIVVAGNAAGTSGMQDFALARFLGGVTDPLAGTPSQRFVAQVYLDLLGRVVDSAGLAFWTNQLDTKTTRNQVARAIENSAEYRNRVVDHLYQTLLLRAADTAGRDHWTAFLGTGSAEQLEAIFLGSEEYLSKNNLGPNGFVAAVYRDVLHRNLDDSGRQNWQHALDSGVSRTSVAAAILASQESDRIEVKQGYHQFLKRSADQSGLASFVDALQHGVTNEDFFAALIGSMEYFTLTQQ